MSMFAESDIPLPAIVVWLRVVGVLCPIAGFIWAGANNVDDATGIAIMLGSLILTLLWFAMGSAVRLLNRIEKRLSHPEAGRVS
jgi:hypothetical protein